MSTDSTEKDSGFNRVIVRVLTILAVPALLYSAYAYLQNQNQDQQIRDLTTQSLMQGHEIDWLRARNDYQEDIIATYLLPPDRPVDPCIIERLERGRRLVSLVPRATADTYMARYRTWAASKPPPIEATSGYNLSDGAIQGMLDQVQLYSSDAQEAGVRAYFGITNTSPADTVLMLYPLNADGELRPDHLQRDIVTIVLENDYVRPCPRHCD